MAQTGCLLPDDLVTQRLLHFASKFSSVHGQTLAINKSDAWELLNELAETGSVATPTSKTAFNAAVRHFRLEHDRNLLDLDVVPGMFEMLGLGYSDAAWRRARARAHVDKGVPEPALPPDPEVELPTERASDYSKFSREELISLLHQRDRKIQSMTKQLSNSRKRENNWKHNTRDVRERLQEEQDAASWKQSGKRHGLRYFTVRGGHSLALRRSCGNIGASCIGRVLQVDCHGTTVSRWEVLAHAALLVSSRIKYQELEELMYEPSDSIKFALHCIRSDATNKSIWQKCKLHTVLTASRYVLETENGFETHEQEHLTDILVAESGSGVSTHALVKKQIGSVWLPTWTESAAKLSEVCTGSQPRSVRVVMYLRCTDAGSDQIKYRSIAKLETAQCPHLIDFDINCFGHQYHLMSQRSLFAGNEMLAELGIDAKSYFPFSPKLAMSGATLVAKYIWHGLTALATLRLPGALPEPRRNASADAGEV